MYGIHDFWIFLLACLLTWLTPGPDTMYILARSIAQGRRAGMLSALGIGSGLLVHTLLAAFGLSAILATSAFAFAAIKLIGAAYLIYLGVQVLRKKNRMIVTSTIDRLNACQVYWHGALTNLLNPKVVIFFLAFLPQFVDSAAASDPLPFVILGLVFVVGGTLWSLGQAVFAASATQAIRRNTSWLGWIERVSGCIYIGLGLNLLQSKLDSS